MRAVLYKVSVRSVHGVNVKAKSLPKSIVARKIVARSTPESSHVAGAHHSSDEGAHRLAPARQANGQHDDE